MQHLLTNTWDRCRSGSPPSLTCPLRCHACCLIPGPVVPLNPKLFPEGHPERNAPIVSALASLAGDDRLHRLQGLSESLCEHLPVPHRQHAAGRSEHGVCTLAVPLLHALVGFLLTLAPSARSLEQIPAANAMRTGDNLTTVVVRQTRPLLRGAAGSAAVLPPASTN